MFSLPPAQKIGLTNADGALRWIDDESVVRPVAYRRSLPPDGEMPKPLLVAVQIP
jgi:hypothetical protein